MSILQREIRRQRIAHTKEMDAQYEESVRIATKCLKDQVERDLVAVLEKIINDLEVQHGRQI